MRVLLTMLIAAFGFAALADMPAPQGRVLVTVGGDLPEGNMPPRHEDDVGFFGFFVFFGFLYFMMFSMCVSLSSMSLPFFLYRAFRMASFLEP